MKKSEKKMILILVIVAVIMIALLFRQRGTENENIGGQTNDNNVTTNTVGQNSSGDNLVEVLEDGTMLNVSDKLSEKKTFGSYELSNIQLTEKDGLSQLLADVKNISSTKTGTTFVDITLLDKSGNTITTISGIIAEAEPGATVKLTARGTTDFSDAYDFTIQVSNK